MVRPKLYLTKMIPGWLRSLIGDRWMFKFIDPWWRQIAQAEQEPSSAQAKINCTSQFDFYSGRVLSGSSLAFTGSVQDHFQAQKAG